MVVKRTFIVVPIILLMFVVSCSVAGKGGVTTPQPTILALSTPVTMIPSVTAGDLPSINNPVYTQQSNPPDQTASPTSIFAPTPTESGAIFKVG